MHPALRRIDHRPWPLPTRPWAGRQSWRDLLFAHWPVPTATIRHLVPREIAIQEFDGTSWIGIVPFRMADVMLRGIPALPWISAFPELNVRLYVEYGGKPGVWFLSLDASNWLAVWTAKRLVHLPYFHARMSATENEPTTEFASLRINDARVTFEASYRPTSETYATTPGSLEHWLTERYCLYAQAPDGTLYRTEIHHQPWPLQRAHAEIERNEMATPHGITLPGTPPHLHFSKRIDVVTWLPERVLTPPSRS